MRSMDDEDIDFTLQVVEEEDINNIFPLAILLKSTNSYFMLISGTAWVEYVCHLSFGIYHVNSYKSD